MKQKLGVAAGLLLLVVVLAALNAATYVQRDNTADNELLPNRSSYNSGSTGTQAFYTLLAETGRRVTRWRSPVSYLSPLTASADVFVVIGETRVEISDDEAKRVLDWVANGGRLVLIDRSPPGSLMKSDQWRLLTKGSLKRADLSLDPADVVQMTSGVAAAKPAQPSAYTRAVTAIQPSVLASEIVFERAVDAVSEPGEAGGDDSTPSKGPAADFAGQIAPPAAAPKGSYAGPKIEKFGETPFVTGPVAHFAGQDGKTIVASLARGRGSIILVTDPFIVSNTGIARADNAAFAVNLVSGRTGTIAFDEYHQGFGSERNRLFAFFAGTPVVALILQLILLAALVAYSQSRRFARPLPASEPDRLSKLEYVAAMAELQQRMRTYSLAVENVYGEFRRRAARLVGADNTREGRRNMPLLISGRVGMTADEVEGLMSECEEIICGEPTNKQQTLKLIGRLRMLESRLGIARHNSPSRGAGAKR